MKIIHKPESSDQSQAIKSKKLPLHKDSAYLADLKRRVISRHNAKIRKANDL